MADARSRLRAAMRWPRAMVAASASCAALGATLVWAPAPILLWNASPSSPVGLYLVRSPHRLGVGDLAIAWPPASARRLAARRHYLPAGVPLVKNVAASSGMRVCAKGKIILVNGRQAALRRSSDRAGRRLPWWSGCHTLGKEELFLLAPGVPEAFDGRYFGITRAGEIIGKGELLWRR